MRILLIEDEQALARLVEMELLLQGFSVEIRYDGKTGLATALEGSYDIVLLDWMLPDIEGIQVCRALRTHSRVPIIMITARSGVSDEVRGLDAGADDYIVKPFDMEQLVARIRAVARRTEGTGDENVRLSQGGVVLYVDERAVYENGARVHLTNKEFEIFKLLFENRGKVISKESIRSTVWGRDFHFDDGAIAVHVKAIRDKLATVAIENVRGFGYMIPREGRADRD
jgi:two-component system response regulator ArlR